MAEKVIFLGNGALAEAALEVIKASCEVIFRAHKKEDLERVVELKRELPEAHGILASFGAMVPSSVLEVFEPEGILNIHPSLLPSYRGASPIESAILAGDSEFSVSVMKLVKAMDAGPIYYQTTLVNLPLCKSDIYKALATTGAKWICDNLNNLGKPVLQDDGKATFCGKLDKSMSLLTPETDTAEQTLRKIVAYQGFPKPKYAFYGLPCIILEAHIVKQGETALIPLPCADGGVLSIDKLQPEGRKAMDAKSFINGYGR
jgi:methionyl-tRNA formyltransferase